MDKVTCVVVGDRTSGKHKLCAHFCYVDFDGYVPTVIEDRSIKLIVDNKPCMIRMKDTTGQEDYERLRPLAYPGTDCFLLCYSCTSPATFYNAKNRWLKEIRDHCPDTPFILVCINSDKRKDTEIQGFRPISYCEGAHLANTISAENYVEVTFSNHSDVIEAFSEAVRAHRKTTKKIK